MLALVGLAGIPGCGMEGQEDGGARQLPKEVSADGKALYNGVDPPASPDTAIFNLGQEGGTNEVSEIRDVALREAALKYGSQYGRWRRAWELLGVLEERESELSTVYDFNRVSTAAPRGAGHVIPPVVIRAHNAFNSRKDGSVVSVADEYLNIRKPGQISPVVPTWRSYLLSRASAPEAPARGLLPSSDAERERFRDSFDEGWDAGRRQADEEFAHRMQRLSQDFEGMLRYRRLVALGMMNKMVLADADFGVTENGDTMRIGERVVQIVRQSEFQPDSDRWFPSGGTFSTENLEGRSPK